MLQTVFATTTEVPELDICFSGVDDDVRCELNAKLICAKNSQCNIMHEDIVSIEVDPSLPSYWPIALEHNKEATHYNEIILPCKHTFHVSCLIVHFQTNNMRCPVCRGGYNCKLLPEHKGMHLALPKKVQIKNKIAIDRLIVSYTKYLLSYTNRNPPSPVASPRPATVNLDAIRQEFYLVAQFDDGSPTNRVQHTSQITSRLILPASTSSDMLEVTLQHSFVRHLGKQLFSLRNPTNFNRLFCCIKHPCIPEGIQTTNLRFAEPSNLTTSWPNVALIHSDVLQALEYEKISENSQIAMICDLIIGDLNVGVLKFSLKENANNANYKLVDFSISLNVEITMQVVLAHVEHVVHMITSAFES